jgi:rubrerythrin
VIAEPDRAQRRYAAVEAAGLSGARTRREALRIAALGAGAVAGAGLLRPVAARAQSTVDENLRDFLAPTIALEQIAVFAYDAALGSREVSDAEARVFERFRDQEQAHADALRQALDSIGFDAPEAPDSAADSGVFEGVDGIDDARARQLADTLAEVGELQSVNDFLGYLAGLERQEIGAYAEAAPTLDSEDLATTSAEIAASQAQHLIVLGALSKRQPADTLRQIEAAASGGGAGS